MPKQEKIQVLDEIKVSLDGAAGLVLADFKGLSVASLEGLRKKVTKEGGTAKVVKNTLLKRALEDLNIQGLEGALKENTILFSSKEDILGILKSLANYSKENEKFILKAGYLDGQAFDKEGIVAMSKLPSKKELLAQVIGNINGVISNFVGTLNSVMTTFVGTIEAIENKSDKK